MRAKPTVMVTCQKIDVKEIQTLKRAHDNQVSYWAELGGQNQIPRRKVWEM